MYLVHLLSRIHGIKSILHYSNSLYHSRYSSIFPEDSLFIQQNNFYCLRDKSSLYNSIIDKLDRRKIETAAMFVANQLNNQMLSNRPSSSSTSSSSSRRKNGRGVTAAVKWTWLGNYIEQIAR